MKWSTGLSAWAAPVTGYLEGYWPCTGRLSAVNAIGTQLRDLINSGLTRWRLTVSMIITYMDALLIVSTAYSIAESGRKERSP